MKEITSAAISTTKIVADPLTLADEELFSIVVRHCWLLNDILVYYISGGRVCVYVCMGVLSVCVFVCVCICVRIVWIYSCIIELYIK
jgi:hypothetical protein